MKYHYKSPHQLKEQIAQERASSASEKRRGWGMRLILADIMILALVVAAVQYSGILTTSESTSKTIQRRGDLEFSGSLKRETRTRVFYLNVRNDGAAIRSFPEPNEVRQATAEIGVSPALISTEFALARRALRPGETSIYRAELQLPASAPTDATQESARIRVELADGPLVIEL